MSRLTITYDKINKAIIAELLRIQILQIMTYPKTERVKTITPSSLLKKRFHLDIGSF
jgi:hypothetical protein